MANTKTVHSIKGYTEGFVILNENGNNANGIVRYRMLDQNTCEVYEVTICEGYEDEEESLIRIAFEDIVESGFVPVPACEKAKKWYQSEQKKMSGKDLVIDVLPNKADGDKRFGKNKEGYVIFIEYPVREACMALDEKGIKTIMSSANLEDAKSADIPEKSGDVLYIGQNTHFSIGNGYAWIMIDYDALSRENKEIIQDLNSGEMPIELTDLERQRLIHHCQVNNCPVTQRELVKLYRVIDRGYFMRGRISNVGRDEYFVEHSEPLLHSNSLSYHGADYGAVVLRYPIDEKTTTDEVIEYFRKLVAKIKEHYKINFIKSSR